MAVIKLNVSTNFKEASKEFDALGTESEAVQKRIKRLQTEVSGDQFDKFSASVKRAQAAITATRGKTAGLEAAQSKLRIQIEKMIRAGVDPLDDSLNKLQKEYAQTTKQIEKNKMAQDANTKAAQFAKTAMLALGAAAVGSAIAVGKNVVEMAKAGDQYAKTARAIGITAEDLQELQFVADRSGVSNEALNTALKKLNKNIGDVRANTGSLTTLLKVQNPELLTQLKNVSSNEEAFALLTDEIGSMRNETDRAALAQAAFGKAGQDLINVALLGADGIAELRDEARDYGLISNDAAKASEDFVDAQTNARAAVKGIRNEFAERMLPVMTDVLKSFTDFITNQEKMKRTLDVILPILGAVAAGLATFLILTKATAIIQGLAGAMRILNTVFLQNPIVLVVMAIVAVSILLYRNWDKVVVLFQTTIAILQARFEQFGSAIKTSWIRAFNSVKIVVLELAGVILDKLMGVVNKFLDLAGRLPIIGEKFQGLQENVNNLAATLQNAKDQAIADSEAKIQAAKDEQAAIRERADASVQATKEESAARLQAIKEQEEANQNADFSFPGASGGGDGDSQGYAERLNAEIAFYDAQVFNYDMFLRAKEKLDEEAAEKRKAVRSAEIKATGDLFSALSDLVSAYGDDNEAAVIASKALASTSAAINSYLAFTQVLADATIPSTFAKIAMAGAVLASGLAQQKNIWSAETGGTFTVPSNPSSSRGDSQTVAVNPGEEVSVTPRGETGGKMITVNNYFDKSLLWSVTQEGIDQGEITITNDNIRGGVA